MSKIDSAAQRRQRLLNATARPARTLLALRVLSDGLAANDAVDTSALQTFINDGTHRTSFVERVMQPLFERGLVFKPRQHGWRLSAEGTHMLQRLEKLLPSDASNPAPRPKLPEIPYVGQVVPPAQINRMAGSYDKDECNFSHVRPGALDFRDLPSRRGNELVYRDGRREPIDHARIVLHRPPADPAPAAPAIRTRKRAA